MILWKIYGKIVYVSYFCHDRTILLVGSGQAMVALTSADLKSASLFSCLDIEQLEQLLSGHRETVLEVGQIVLSEQDWDDSIYFLRSGLAKVRTYSADGDEVIMCLLGPGDVFGEMAVVERAFRSADVVSLTPLHLVKLRSLPFKELLRLEPEFALALARLESSRLRDLNMRFVLQTADATTRLLDALSYLARKTNQYADPNATIPPLAQKEIALIAGLSRETTSRTLGKLRARSTVVVTEEGGLKIADLQPLLKRGLLPES